ncbi:phosphodiester glycosidase family protein [Pedobacter sp. KBW06]|uniref:phosphodiester glycosidase family protein n=1 Tax=Pedobacter sp. KBW06 TaxID=2153359 RepID=UPI0018F37153|nr:phosphodiester glycosidase family protein [Pedobacter sp. KBW06]
MNSNKIFLSTTLLVLITTGMLAFAQKPKSDDEHFLSYIVDTKKQDIKLYWKDDRQEIFKSIQNLKSWLDKKHKKLVFAMNAGMYKKDNSAQGLFIENQKLVTALDTTSGAGNFYLKPNGVFYIRVDNLPFICTTSKFINNGKLKYASQSGPMLVIDGQIHSAFKEGSTNLNIRNGVGILPDNRVVFAMSKTEMNFYDFANFFKKMGCKNALYLDGLVSRAYLPEKNWKQTDGNFGVIIGVTADPRQR